MIVAREALFSCTGVHSARSLLSRAPTLSNYVGGRQRRSLSNRASSILSPLGISITEDVPGVYDGDSWKGSGDIISSICPTTGEVLARVKTVSARYIGQIPDSEPESNL